MAVVVLQAASRLSGYDVALLCGSQSRNALSSRVRKGCPRLLSTVRIKARLRCLTAVVAGGRYPRHQFHIDSDFLVASDEDALTKLSRSIMLPSIVVVVVHTSFHPPVGFFAQCFGGAPSFGPLTKLR
ncbi:hypothetical protein VFPPC_17891 [Pochonia chlamydosporia 170]|uniref:Uncharacterized protein n=1 Tax=Pochonia chlamydosporia 170 TaxID=1380566 RepID=A0A219AQ30_METCM|nr:hypothetical protein VFPPC_17891 [Pochonia chlamydosporia 170]OWT42916.1 hypothetical protein VFPPC_17891 [Pochonia chlamydosporia 170]